MDIPVIDRSKYLKGLLIIAKKDNQLNDNEKNFIRGIANKLGFATDFYEDTLKSLLANKYISEDPIEFTDIKIAESFISDGLRLAFSDEKVSDTEINWLRTAAAANGIPDEWFAQALSSMKNSQTKSLLSDYALYSII